MSAFDRADESATAQVILIGSASRGARQPAWLTVADPVAIPLAEIEQ
jgi:hypothetical protein